MINNNDNKFNNLPAPPPPMFVGTKEKDFVKQIQDEIAERVIGQEVAYYSIDLERTNFHPVYGEAIEKTYLNPIHIYCLVEWKGYVVEQTQFGIDKRHSILIHFSSRRLKEDIDLYVREGDFVAFGDKFYEIIKTQEPNLLYGQHETKVEVDAECLEARDGLFNGE